MKEKPVPQQPDILIFLSDQHDGRVMGCAGHPVINTPHMDALAAEGTVFEQTYTPCPLCVPARMSMLTGRLPMHTGIYTNRSSIHPDMPTFLHSLALIGYETVLCGRMHFEGSDQRHGFTRRIAGDITPTAVGPATDSLEDLGPLAPLLSEPGCIHAIGGGTSPTLEYDRYVIRSARDYLSTPHVKPQCLVVGTYGPHFPYIAPPELYEKYLPLTILPLNLEFPVYTPDNRRIRDTTPEIVRGAQAAYWGMIEFEDSCLGEVKEAWEQYLARKRREGIFIYTSDHGDHAGDRGFYGKQSLYEPALRIPLIITGTKLPSNQRSQVPVSLLDLAPTLCELTGAQTLPRQDGYSLLPELSGSRSAADPARAVISEWINLPYMQGTDYGRMIRKNEWKLISYARYPEEAQLYRPESDPWEMDNLAANHPDIVSQLTTEAYHSIDSEKIVAEKNIRDRDYLIAARFNRQSGVENTDLWSPTEAARTLPEKYLSTTLPMPERFLKYGDKK